MSDPIDELMKLNCSTIFLLHPLGLERKKLEDFGFKECYLKDEYNEVDYKNPVFLLFKPDDITLFQEFLDTEYFRENPHTNTFDIREDYDRGNGNIVLVYEFPERFDDDFQKFKEGKYSKFSKSMINTYPKTIKVKESGRDIVILGTQYRIITKDKNSSNLMEEHHGKKSFIQAELRSMTEMLEDRFGTIFTPDMEVWQKPDINKETLKDGNK